MAPGKKTTSPRRKHGRQSIRLTRNGFALHGQRLYLAKVGDVEVRWSRPLPSAPSSGFEPTSRVCSAGGVKDGPKPLSVRAWTWCGCGAVHDRDVNAAKNILAAGRADRLNACRGDVRPGPDLAVAGEAGTHRSAA